MTAADYSWGPDAERQLTIELGQLQLQADALARQDRDAILLWLRWSGAADRTELATRLLIGSVFAQAGLLGVVTCTRCGDRGCDWCRGQL